MITIIILDRNVHTFMEQHVHRGLNVIIYHHVNEYIFRNGFYYFFTFLKIKILKSKCLYFSMFNRIIGYMSFPIVTCIQVKTLRS